MRRRTKCAISPHPICVAVAGAPRYVRLRRSVAILAAATQSYSALLGTDVTRERQDLEALFLANLSWIDRTAAALARRYGLSGEEGREFTSWARLRLIENDYAALGKFRGESSLTTYLAVVLGMLLRDYRTHHWGRWRPSAAAQRQGALAVRLETLVYRDRLPLAQAGERLRTAGLTTLSDRALAAILSALPVRQRMRPDEVDLASAVLLAETSADDGIAGDEREAERRVLGHALTDVLAGLSPEDQLIVRMRYWKGMGVADIARTLRTPQKPLYKRLDRILRRVRQRLEASGVSPERAGALLAEPAP